VTGCKLHEPNVIFPWTFYPPTRRQPLATTAPSKFKPVNRKGTASFPWVPERFAISRQHSPNRGYSNWHGQCITVIRQQTTVGGEKKTDPRTMARIPHDFPPTIRVRPRIEHTIPLVFKTRSRGRRLLESAGSHHLWGYATPRAATARERAAIPLPCGRGSPPDLSHSVSVPSIHTVRASSNRQPQQSRSNPQPGRNRPLPHCPSHRCAASC